MKKDTESPRKNDETKKNAFIQTKLSQMIRKHCSDPTGQKRGYIFIKVPNFYSTIEHFSLFSLLTALRTRFTKHCSEK